MKSFYSLVFWLLFLLIFTTKVGATELDSAQKNKSQKTNFPKNSSVYYSPKIAATLSAILPGAGQVYNKKYWKAPIVYGVLGYIGYDIYANYVFYKKLSFALSAFNKALNKDSTDYKQLEPVLTTLSFSSLQNYKNHYRKQVDESSLWLLVFWLLNAVDAGVDAHLKNFDISENLSLRIKPQIEPINFSNNLNYQINFTLGFKHRKKKQFISHLATY